MDEDPDERRQRFLERNRAAASRCRQKRKLWVSSLEKKAEELTSQNIQLSVSGSWMIIGIDESGKVGLNQKKVKQYHKRWWFFRLGQIQKMCQEVQKEALNRQN